MRQWAGMMRSRLIRLLVIALLFAGCSRPPKVLQPQSKISADGILALAQKLEQKGAMWESRQSYQSAYSLYQSFGDIEAQLYCKSGLARIALQEENLDEYLQIYNEISGYKTAAPETKYILLLLELYRHEKEGNYQLISEIAQDAYEYPLPVRIQILAHRLQAASFLKPDFPSPVFSNLKRLATRYQMQLKKDFAADATVLSMAEYAMAYHKYLSQDFKAAGKHIDKAIDLDYRYENFDALAASYRLRGRVWESLQQPEAAISAYYKAYEIYGY